MPFTPQKYPPENGHGPQRWVRWYVDDVTGRMHAEDEVTRDWYGRLRWVPDIDAPDVDEQRSGFDVPTERTLDEP